MSGMEEQEVQIIKDFRSKYLRLRAERGRQNNE